MVLPSGLVWSDEYAWTPVQQSSDYSLTGALIVQESVRLAGRAMTLTGQSDGADHTAWITRSDLTALQTALTAAGATLTLTLHDGRVFTVAPRHDGDGPLQATPLPAYRSLLPANPSPSHWYLLREIRLMEV